MPYAECAAARPRARVLIAKFSGGLLLERISFGGYAPDGCAIREVCIAVTRLERPPKEEAIVLNSTCFRAGSSVSLGR